MNAQGRDTCDGFRQLHQLVRKCRFRFRRRLFMTQYDLARNAQVAIKPRVPKPAAVALLEMYTKTNVLARLVIHPKRRATVLR